MPRHCENAQKVAEWLLAREDVAWVNYPGLKDNKYHALAEKYMPNGSCGVISFGLKGGRQAAGEFMDKLKFVVEAGVDPSLIRLSVGIEDVDDIIEDLRQALED